MKRAKASRTNRPKAPMPPIAGPVAEECEGRRRARDQNSMGAVCATTDTSLEPTPVGVRRTVVRTPLAVSTVLFAFGLSACSSPVHPYRALAPALNGGVNCSAGPRACPLPAGLNVSVTNIERKVAVQGPLRLGHGGFYVRLDLVVTAQQSYAIADADIRLASPEGPPPPAYADYSYTVVPSSRGCSIPVQPPSEPVGTGPGTPPVLTRGHYGPYSVCFAVPGVASEPLRLTWTFRLIDACLGPAIKSYPCNGAQIGEYVAAFVLPR